MARQPCGTREDGLFASTQYREYQDGEQEDVLGKDKLADIDEEELQGNAPSLTSGNDDELEDGPGLDAVSNEQLDTAADEGNSIAGKVAVGAAIAAGTVATGVGGTAAFQSVTGGQLGLHGAATEYIGGDATGNVGAGEQEQDGRPSRAATEFGIAVVLGLILGSDLVRKKKTEKTNPFDIGDEILVTDLECCAQSEWR